MGSRAGSRRRLLGETGDGTLGHLESGPDVHVDDDPDDLEDLLLGEVRGERVVPGTEIVGDGRIRDASERLGVGEGSAGRGLCYALSTRIVQLGASPVMLRAVRWARADVPGSPDAARVGSII
ncbi:hypothetical protein [Micromonospora musae]|uniref:hypothetical protein n=1 Tax=Micromonospora musae TaxID=1894970 RepID=UPI0033F887C6